MTTPSTPATTSTPLAAAITPEQLLASWQGHRRLTRRLIDVFPDEELFSLTIGGMRTFGAISIELLNMALPTVRGIVTERWETMEKMEDPSKDDILREWDRSTSEIDALWPQIPVGRFQEVRTAFGQWTMPVHDLLLYIIDNEVHHRGQGYVYLRALGVEPPPFYERG